MVIPKIRGDTTNGEAGVLIVGARRVDARRIEGEVVGVRGTADGRGPIVPAGPLSEEAIVPVAAVHE